ncbi:hypothetical protein ABZ924_20585 [Streptomyces sp. NPDC046876]|uniref:hypothetical protein n=1 Tax=Streptomyces sp. NPDC046876 TaxID=3155616 RepID=UPI0033FA0A34
MHRSTPFLIIGHHRSGTNFLGEPIQRNPVVARANEPFSMRTDFFRDNDLRLWFAAVVKGGAWNKSAALLACAARRGRWYIAGSASIGFRVAW